MDNRPVAANFDPPSAGGYSIPIRPAASFASYQVAALPPHQTTALVPVGYHPQGTPFYPQGAPLYPQAMPFAPAHVYWPPVQVAPPGVVHAGVVHAASQGSGVYYSTAIATGEGASVDSVATVAPHPSGLAVQREPSQRLSQAYALLNNPGKVGSAEFQFRRILADCPAYRHHATVGLGRALFKMGGFRRWQEARQLLEQLKDDYPCYMVDGVKLSTVAELDLTLSRIYQALMLWPKSAELLQALAKDINPSLGKTDLSLPCGNMKIDLSRVRQLEKQGDYSLAEQLLQSLLPTQQPDNVRTLYENFDGYQTQVHLMGHRGLYRWAWSLQQNIARLISEPKQTFLDDRITPCGDPTVDLSRIYLLENEGDYQSAETMLLAASLGVSPQEALNHRLKPSTKHGHNAIRIRLMRKQGDYDAIAALLRNMAELEARQRNLNYCVSAANEQTTACGDYSTDLCRVEHLIWLGQDEQAKALLEAMVKHKRKGLNASDWSLLCDVFILDLTRARFQQTCGHYQQAGTLLLKMAIDLAPKQETKDSLRDGKHLSSDNHELDLARIELFLEQGDKAAALSLLMDMTRQQTPRLNQDDLPRASDHKALDLLRVDLLLAQEELDSAEILLQALAHIQDSRLTFQAGRNKATPCGHLGIDSRRARLLSLRDQDRKAGSLLQAMACKTPLKLAADDWTRPSGNADLDLARARSFIRRTDFQNADLLLTACREYYPFRPEFLELYLNSLGERQLWTKFDQAVEQLPQQGAINQNHHWVQLARSVRHFQQALYLYENGDMDAFQSSCQQALTIATALLEQHKGSAAAMIQKAHCLRLLGADQKTWRALFRRARNIDPDRFRYEQEVSWRAQEGRVLNQLSFPAISTTGGKGSGQKPA